MPTNPLPAATHDRKAVRSGMGREPVVFANTTARYAVSTCGVSILRTSSAVRQKSATKRPLSVPRSRRAASAAGIESCLKPSVCVTTSTRVADPGISTEPGGDEGPGSVPPQLAKRTMTSDPSPQRQRPRPAARVFELRKAHPQPDDDKGEGRRRDGVRAKQAPPALGHGDVVVERRERQPAQAFERRRLRRE